MPKPKNIEYNLKERLQKIYEAGVNIPEPSVKSNLETIPTLQFRIRELLNILKFSPVKATTMNYLIMYDIENNKVRTRIAKYLEKKGCKRIQKSIFMTNSEFKGFNEIYSTLLDVQSYYQNQDSILLIPFNTKDLRSIKIIGKDINIQTLVEKPTTLFF